MPTKKKRKLKLEKTSKKLERKLKLGRKLQKKLERKLKLEKKLQKMFGKKLK